MTTYLSAVPLAMVRTQSGGYVNVLEGDHVPGDILEEDLERLLGRGWLVEAPTADEAGDDKPTTVPDILAAVGTDKALAQQYLDEENKAKKPRVSLVEPLQAIVDAE